MNTINPMSGITSFQGRKITILAKENKHKEYLYNEVVDFIKDKGVTTTFHVGSKEGRIVVDTASDEIFNTVQTGLNKLGVVTSTTNEKVAQVLNKVG
ncbi:MAG: hypothetical protein E7Z93_07605 [Cyanobacteria bacterium SIG32]|nr:hypothetical protein [Cyanobacteria bacterium SIG32]